MKWMRALLIGTVIVIGQQVAAGAGPGEVETYDDELERVTERVPTFCGVWVDEEAGELKICLKDGVGDLLAAREAVLEILGDDPEDAALDPVVVKGDYDWRQVKRWYEKIPGSDVWSVADVTFTDMDETINRIVIGVVDLSQEELIRRELDRIGIPQEAVVVEEAGYAIAEPLIVQGPESLRLPLLDETMPISTTTPLLPIAVGSLLAGAGFVAWRWSRRRRALR